MVVKDNYHIPVGKNNRGTIIDILLLLFNGNALGISSNFKPNNWMFLLQRFMNNS